LSIANRWKCSPQVCDWPAQYIILICLIYAAIQSRAYTCFGSSLLVWRTWNFLVDLSKYPKITDYLSSFRFQFAIKKSVHKRSASKLKLVSSPYNCDFYVYIFRSIFHVLKNISFSLFVLDLNLIQSSEQFWLSYIYFNIIFYNFKKDFQ